MTKIMFSVVAVVLCAGFYASGCEENDGCELTRGEAYEVICLAQFDVCELCSLFDESSLACRLLPQSRENCRTDVSYLSDADVCVDSKHEKRCDALVRVLETTSPEHEIYDDCDETFLNAWRDADEACSVSVTYYSE